MSRLKSKGALMIGIEHPGDVAQLCYITISSPLSSPWPRRPPCCAPPPRSCLTCVPGSPSHPPPAPGGAPPCWRPCGRPTAPPAPP
eukprot:1138642-Pyramimonas_sp.AAC.1